MRSCVGSPIRSRGGRVVVGVRGIVAVAVNYHDRTKPAIAKPIGRPRQREVAATTRPIASPMRSTVPWRTSVGSRRAMPRARPHDRMLEIGSRGRFSRARRSGHAAAGLSDTTDATEASIAACSFSKSASASRL